ncbi:MAG: MATE family efflux transporter, partial [Gemmatimonadetes bacterium]|nr:MATE family efflux transporter [Gemmatimonadota bacterium]
MQVGILAQGLVDTAMVGRVDATQLGAVTLGNLYFFGVSVFGMGLLLALDPIVSQAFGAEDRDAMEVAVQRGFVLSFAVAVLAA